MASGASGRSAVMIADIAMILSFGEGCDYSAKRQRTH
jgi:hypothetical protein